MSVRSEAGARAVRQRDPARSGRVRGAIVVVVTVWSACAWIGLDPFDLVDARSLAASGRFLSGFVPPARDAAFLARVLEAAWTTVAIATAGLAVALLVGVPLALTGTARLSLSAIGRPMSRAGVSGRIGVRGLALVLRGVPELVWALLFVRVTGLGAGAGALAIAFAGAGSIAKVYAEILEAAPRAPVEALLANGATRLQATLYGALAQCADELISYTVYRWECAVRASAVLGFVGAGGLGQEIELSMRAFAGDEVATLLLVLVALVLAADRASGLLRRVSRDGHGGRRALVTALVAGLACTAWVEWNLGRLLEPGALERLGEFASGMLTPPGDAVTLRALGTAALETLAMAGLGTLAAVLPALGLALLARADAVRAWPSPATRSRGVRRARRSARVALRGGARLALATTRAIPELVWATLLIVAVGLGPVTGTIALCVHTLGTLGRLFAETIENAESTPDAPAAALLANGASAVRAFVWGTLPTAGARLSSHVLYRLEANVRAAAVLGVVGAGGLGQRLYVETSLFRFDAAAATVLATLALVAAVDGASHALRRRLVG